MQVFRVPKVCSAITIGGLNAENLSKLDKSEFILKIINKVKEQQQQIDNIDRKKYEGDFREANSRLMSSLTQLRDVKTIFFVLNKKRWWSWFTPFKFAYSYEGNARHCSVFYINVDFENILS